MSYSYSLNCLQYVLTENGKPIGRVLDEVSLAFDKEDGILHKHGAPEVVDAWFKKTQSRFREAGFPEMADNLVVLTGRFPLDDLNKCLSTSGYALHMYTQAVAGALVPLSEFPETVPTLTRIPSAPARRAIFPRRSR